MPKVEVCELRMFFFSSSNFDELFTIPFVSILLMQMNLKMAGHSPLGALAN